MHTRDKNVLKKKSHQLPKLLDYRAAGPTSKFIALVNKVVRDGS
jgi:hypothetical protein